MLATLLVMDELGDLLTSFSSPVTDGVREIAHFQAILLVQYNENWRALTIL